MTKREHHEEHINLLAGDDRFAVLEALVRVSRLPTGLSWFTDQQVTEIRDEMMRAAARQRRREASFRTHYAAREADPS